MPHLVLIETSGTQAYIFATNRLRQNVGASELCYRVGTEWTLEAVRQVTDGPSLWCDDTAERARRLLDPASNPRLADGRAGVEVVVATSARAVLLVAGIDAEQEAATARRIVTLVTRRALAEAPGLGVTGLVRRVRSRHDLQAELARAKAEIAGVRAGLPAPEQRFLRLPPVAACATTDLPAAVWAPPMGDERAQAQSDVARRKFAAANAARRRIAREATIADRRLLDRDVGQLERHLAERWVAVIHGDGNGMGRVFQELGERARELGADYADAYRRLSLALDLATLRAFDSALREITQHGDEFPRVVPLVLGGDDLTVLCDGVRALPFARRYLARFEEECTHDAVARWSGGLLTASAGIAIVKPHFPFHAAYELAEGLLADAKGWARREAGGRAAFDFLLLHDSIAGEVGALRGERWKSRDGRIALWAGPYLLGDVVSEAGTLTRHAASELDQRVAAIHDRDPATGRRRVPRTVLHDLRTALSEGRTAAAARLELVDRAPLEPLLTGGSLWWEEDGRLVCPAFDAMDAARLMEDAS